MFDTDIFTILFSIDSHLAILVFLPSKNNQPVLPLYLTMQILFDMQFLREITNLFIRYLSLSNSHLLQHLLLQNQTSLVKRTVRSNWILVARNCVTEQPLVDNSCFFQLNNRDFLSTWKVDEVLPKIFATTLRALQNFQLKVLCVDPLIQESGESFIRFSDKDKKIAIPFLFRLKQQTEVDSSGSLSLVYATRYLQIPFFLERNFSLTTHVQKHEGAISINSRKEHNDKRPFVLYVLAAAFHGMLRSTAFTTASTDIQWKVPRSVKISSYFQPFFCFSCFNQSFMSQ